MAENTGSGMNEPRAGGAGLQDVQQRVGDAAQRVMQSDTVKNVQAQGREAMRTVQERIQAQGPELVDRVKQLASEANVRRISLQQDGKTILEFPLPAAAA